MISMLDSSKPKEKIAKAPIVTAPLCINKAVCNIRGRPMGFLIIWMFSFIEFPPTIDCHNSKNKILNQSIFESEINSNPKAIST